MNPTTLTLAFLMGATAFAIDGSVPAIPTTAEFFGVDIGQVQFSIGLYILGYALGQIPMGMLADQFGRRPVALICMSSFVLCGFFASISNTIEMLLLFRFLQGWFGASGAVVSRAVVRDITDGKETGRMMALLTSTQGVVMISAPILGAIVLNLSWRTPFFISSVFGAIGVTLMWFYVPETLKQRPNGGLSLRLKQGIAAYLHSKQSIIAALLASLTFSSLICFITLSSEVFIIDFGLTEFTYAFVFALASAGYITGGLLSRKLLANYAAFALSILLARGFALCAVAFALSLSFKLESLFTITPLAVMLFILVGAMLSVATTLALQPLQKTAGMAAALLGTFQLAVGGLYSVLMPTLPGSAIVVLQIALMITCTLVFIVAKVGLAGIQKTSEGNTAG